jgi:hypothetical protein
MSNEKFNESQEDPQVAEALRHFRESVHAWSEAEHSKPRLIRQSRRSTVWAIIVNPLLGWSLAAAVLATTVGVPVAVHHQHVVDGQKQDALAKQQKLEQEQASQAAQARAAAIDDDELMSHVDSDIAQDAPDAMQPLSSLMSTSKE